MAASARLEGQDIQRVRAGSRALVTLRARGRGRGRGRGRRRKDRAHLELGHAAGVGRVAAARLDELQQHVVWERVKTGSHASWR